MGEIGDTPLESEFFDIDPQRGVQVTLMAHEVVFIPFAFLSLEPRRPAPLTSTSPRRTRSAGRGGLAGDGRGEDNATGEGGAGMAERSVAVAFVSASHGHVVSVVQVGTCSARSRVLVRRTWGTLSRVDDTPSGWVSIIFLPVRKDGLHLSHDVFKANIVCTYDADALISSSIVEPICPTTVWRGRCANYYARQLETCSVPSTHCMI